MTGSRPIRERVRSKVAPLMFMMIVALVALSVGALGHIPDNDSPTDTAFTHEGIEYIILSEDELTLKVTACIDATPNMTIPDRISHDGKEYTVIRIGDHAFNGMSIIRSIVLPDTLVSIGFESFCKCIGIENMTIPSGVITIGDHAFRECRGLREINLNDGLVTIGEMAFLNCKELTSVTIPSTVTSIGFDAFGENSCLRSIIVDKDNNRYSTIDGILYDKDMTELILCPMKGPFGCPGGSRIDRPPKYVGDRRGAGILQVQ